MFAGPSGFCTFSALLFHFNISNVDRAPASKALLIATVLATLLSHTFQFRSILTFRMNPEILAKLQLWRPFTNLLIFQNGFTAVLLLGLLYGFRVFERLMGTRKFVVCPVL